MQRDELLAWIASLPSDVREQAVEAHLGIRRDPTGSQAPGPHLIGYQASGVELIVQALVEADVRAEDVFVDLGAGLGKVVMLARLLTGATARGIEIQAALVEAARAAAARLGVEVEMVLGDARQAAIADGTVFFLYLPFTGPALAAVLGRLREVAGRRAIVVCALGLDLEWHAPWLARRRGESFWLAIYDSVVPGVAPRG